MAVYTRDQRPPACRLQRQFNPLNIINSLRSLLGDYVQAAQKQRPISVRHRHRVTWSSIVEGGGEGTGQLPPSPHKFLLVGKISFCRKISVQESNIFG